MMTESGYWTPIISDSGFYSTVTITLSPVIMVKTRHWILSEGIIHGLMSARLSRTIVSLAQLALGPKHRDINHMVISDNFQSWTSPGTQSPWTSSNNYHLETGNLYSDLRYNHFYATSPIICTPHVFQARSSITCHLRPRNRVRLTFLQVSRKSSQYEASLHLRLPS